MHIPRLRALCWALAATLAGTLTLALLPTAGCHGGSPAPVTPETPAGLERWLVDDFEGGSDELGEPWEIQPFDGVPPSTYELRGAADDRWLQGTSEAAAALLTHPLNLDARSYPRLRWRWRAEHLPEGADLASKSGDDCAARVFVTFAYEPEQASLGERLARSLSSKDLPGSALCYVWDGSLPAESSLPNPYAERTRVLVVRSGPADAEAWHAEERDVLRDYREAFGVDPPRITGLAVMVDADQTGSRAAAAFDEFEFLPAVAESRQP